ncbi:MAG: NAD-dependent epimerase/dehydratase family protein [Magnetococcales bacterium]|nr:NAD-dependent epimerase/dehydratase family protein [Magnetococcales bacterium]
MWKSSYAPGMDTLFTSLLKDDVEFVVARVGTAWQPLRNGRIFLTGGTGFFGIWLLATLQAANRMLGLDCRITVLSRYPERFLARFPGFGNDPAIEWLTGRLESFVFPKGSFTHLMHAAAETSGEVEGHPLLSLERMYGGTRRVLEFAGEAGVRRLLYLSSGAAYGPLPPDCQGVREDMNLAPATDDPRATYGMGKRLSEHLCLQFARERNVAATVARCFTFVGPFMPMGAHLAIGSFIVEALEREAIRVKGSGSPVRAYMYVADLIVWLWVMLTQEAPHTIYNVGSDQTLSIADLARLTGRILAPDKPVLIEGRQSADNHRHVYAPAITRARHDLGLGLHFDLTTGITRTAAWYQTMRTQPERPQPIPTPAKSETFVIDIDGVIATLTPGNDYALAAPLTHNIKAINALHAAGHRIILLTARGSATGIDWHDITRNQLETWGLRYHELRFGKPAADYYVDDRLVSLFALSELATGS